MIAAIIAWAVAILVVGLLVAGLVVGKRRKSEASGGLSLSPSPDDDAVQRAEELRNQIQQKRDVESFGHGPFTG